MRSPSTRSGMVVVLEKHMVRRTSRLIRVRRLIGLLSMLCVFSLPMMGCSDGLYRSHAPSHPCKSG